MKVNFYRDELDDAEEQPHLFALLDKRERQQLYGQLGENEKHNVSNLMAA